jgi:O-antigen ligase
MAAPIVPRSTRDQPTTRERIALLLLQVGVVAIVLVALPFKSFDLDRFFVIKELVLHVSAMLAALLCLGGRRQLDLSAADLLLVVFLLVSGVSAVFAQNGWAATRALSMSISGALLFWSATSLRQSGLHTKLLSAIALAVVIGALTALIQAYAGATTEYFSLNRAPGGTFGNRNFMAHLAAIGAPAVVLAALAARSRGGFLLGAVGSVILAAALVLSRSRAAWLALAAAAVVILGLAVALRVSISGGRTWGRLRILVAAAVVGGLAAAFLPNRLEWKSESPYLDSVVGVVNYKEGSGAGRLVQYGNSMRMAAAHPIVGVGPGNWAVAYPKYASSGDPSLAGDPGMTDNPWPSSDWVAFISERGVIATLCLALTMIALVFRSIGHLRVAGASDPEQTTMSLMLIGTVITTVATGALDAVLLVAIPTMFFWLLAGLLAPPPSRGRTITAGVHQFAPAVLVLLGAFAIGRSAFQIAAMQAYSASSRLSVMESAARMDPGSYRIKMRLAEAYLGRGDCSKAVSQAQAARRLFPNAGDPRAVLRRCGAR